ncbi:MAG: class I SAM-dependent methyltransferase [Acidobacteriota bacterium]
MERMLEATARAEDLHFWFRGLRRTSRLLLDGAIARARAGRPLRQIVDCGSGTGRNLDWLSAYGRTVGVELSPVGLRVGRSKRRPMVQASVTALPFADATADLATSFDVLYCLEDDSERRALREMWRILTPGGLALVNVAALDILHGSHSTLTHEVRRYTPARLRARLEDAGFRIERMSFTNLTAFPPALVVRGLERLTGKAAEASESDLRVPMRPINLALDVALTVEAVAMRVVNLPIGTSVMAVAQKAG